MPISLPQEFKRDCPKCRHRFNELVWLAIDLGERRDLCAGIADGSFAGISCPQCGNQEERPEPLILLRAAEDAPLIQVSSVETLQKHDPFEDGRAIASEVMGRLGGAAGDIPGPMLLAPWVCVQLGLRRDLGADAAESKRALQEVRDEYGVEVERTYSLFLRDIVNSGTQRRLNLAIRGLFSVTNASELEELFDQCPELATEEARANRADWVHHAQDDEERAVAEGHLALITEAAEGDYEAAWHTHEQRLLEFSDSYVNPQIEGLLIGLESETDPERIINQASELLRLAEQIGNRGLEAEAARRLAFALFSTREADPVRLPRAIELMERAVAIFEEDPELGDEPLRAVLLQNLGVAMAERTDGDPVAVQQLAIECQGRALHHLSIDNDGKAWATAKTNLALSQLELARLQPAGSTSASRQKMIMEAIGHLEDALRFRSFEREPLDWAYTQINLGVAFTHRHSVNRQTDIERASAHYRDAIRGFRAAGNDELAAQALSNRARLSLELGAMENLPNDYRHQALELAIEDASAAVELRDARVSPLSRSAALQVLGDVLLRLGDKAAAIKAFDEALDLRDPTVSPRQCRDLGWSLGNLYREAGAWPEAARAYERACLGAITATGSRSSQFGRLEEIRFNGNLFRWAAYAMTRVGRPDRAFELIESGRARELASWLQLDLIDIDALRNLAPTTVERFLELRRALQTIDQDQRQGVFTSEAHSNVLVAELEDLTHEIQQLPGQARFLAVPDFAEIAATVPPGEALVIPLTSPDGSVLLMIDGNAPTEAKQIDLPGISSTDIVRVFNGGLQDEPTPDSFALALGAGGSALDFAHDQMSALLGPKMMHPLAKELVCREIMKVHLIAPRLLALFPLHSLFWEEGGAQRCLLDEVVVSYTPSALALGVCTARAIAHPSIERLVAIGDPMPQRDRLPNAGPEAALVARTLPANEVELLLEREATTQEALAELPGASHVHFACHGRGASSAQALDACLILAGDEELKARELLDLEGFDPRLVVASACFTAQIPHYEESDEMLSLATVFIGAGAAGAIASLWPAHDFGTAVLMSRFYELYAQDADADPAALLRSAQLWLRSQGSLDLAEYVMSRKSLRDHPARRTFEPTRQSVSGGPAVECQPLDQPSIWAAFVFSGA